MENPSLNISLLCLIPKYLDLILWVLSFGLHWRVDVHERTSLQFAHGNSQLILSLKLARTLSFLSLICMCEALSGALERLVLTKDIIIKILSKQEILLMDLPRLVKKTIGK